MATKRKPTTATARKVAGKAKRGPSPAKPASRAAAAAVSAKALAAALARIDALEREVARLRTTPVSVGPGGAVTIEAAGTLLLRAPRITLEAAGAISAAAAQCTIAAGMVNVDSGMTKASGVVSCDTLKTNSVIASSYTPGAGNVW